MRSPEGDVRLDILAESQITVAPELPLASRQQVPRIGRVQSNWFSSCARVGATVLKPSGTDLEVWTARGAISASHIVT